MSRTKRASVASACLLFFIVAGALPSMAQKALQVAGDSREAIMLAPAEAVRLRAGMRIYLESIQGIVAALAESKTTRVPKIAARSGAKMLQNVNPLIGLKLPLGFMSMSFDTHDKFDKLAEKTKRRVSRSEILSDLRDIMGNCISCHASYRLTTK